MRVSTFYATHESILAKPGVEVTGRYFFIYVNLFATFLEMLLFLIFRL